MNLFTGSQDEERLRQRALDEIDRIALRLEERIIDIEEAGLLQGLNEFHTAKRMARELRKQVQAARTFDEFEAVVETLRWIVEELEGTVKPDDVEN